MRVRITSKPTVKCIDGIQLTGFHLGREYDLSAELAELMIVEGWADAVPIEPRVYSAGSQAPPKRARERYDRRSHVRIN